MHYPSENLHRILFLDIETATLHKSYDEASASFKSLWMKKMRRHVSVEEYPAFEEEFASLYHDKGAIYAEFAQVVCISVGYIRREGERHQFKVKYIEGADEHELLSNCIELLDNHYYDRFNQFLCGHNIKEFDIPFLCRRAMVHGLKLPNLLRIAGYKPWQVHHLLDTMEMWKYGDYKHYTSLDLLCHVLGIDTPKGDMDGSLVSAAYWDGEIDTIRSYCCQDVIATAQVYMRCVGLAPFETDDITFVNDSSTTR